MITALHLVGYELPSICGPHKKCLAGKQFATECDVKQAVTFWLQTLDIHLCCAVIQALVSWWDECLIGNGDDVVVWCVPSVTHVICVHQDKNKSFWHESPCNCTVGNPFLYWRPGIRLDIWIGLVTLGISSQIQSVFTDLNRGWYSQLLKYH